MQSIFLGFDTSCYTTSVAAVDASGQWCRQQRKLLPVARGERGLQQSKAVFLHIAQLPDLFRQLLSALPQGAKVQAVCVSSRPRPLEGSYMPVFLAGVSHARMVADALGVPLYETSHQEGHLRAGLYTAGGPEADAFLAIHLSGGTSELLRATRAEDGGFCITLLGGTLDASAGQLIDRVGVALGLPFPAGPHLEKLAQVCESEHPDIPASVKGLDCSFSGAESCAMRMIQSGAPPEVVANAAFSLVTRTLEKWITNAVRETGLQEVLLVGGVSSSAHIRAYLRARLQKKGVRAKLYFASPALSSDNAAGVALLGRDRHLQQNTHEVK